MNLPTATLTMPRRTFFSVFNLSTAELAQAALLAIVFVASAQMGALLFTAPAVISPAPAVAIAGLFLWGLRLWPAILVGAVIQSLLIVDVYTPAYAIYAVSHVIEAVAGAYLLQKLNYDPVIRSLNDILIIMGVSALVSAIVPTISFAMPYFAPFLGITSAPTVVSWGSWWTGYFMSVLVVAPLIMRWVAKPWFKRTMWQAFETIVIFAALIAICYVLFWTPFTNIRGVSLVYLMLVPLFWAAIRFGPRFSILSIFLVMVIGMGGMLFGPTAPAADVAGLRIFQMQVFVIIIAAIFYIVTGLQEERRAAIKNMSAYIGRLEHALNQLSMQDRAKSDFVAVLAHELRNPLAPIVSSLELLRINLPADPKYDNALELMDNRLKTIQRLLDDLLDVSRISRSKLQLKKEQVSLRPIIERSLQSTDHLRAARNQVLTLDLPSEGLVLDADPVRIEQVITNLLTNASKFTPRGGTIFVSKYKEGNEAVIKVKDNGIGIDPDKVDKIFEPFAQLGVSSAEGLGIGLSLTQVLAEMHGGSVSVYSEGEGKGSEFTLRLPILEQRNGTLKAQPGRKGSVVQPAVNSDAGKKVLVVDDNEDAAQGIGKLLEHKGYVVDFAYSGEEAREKTRDFAPAAVVLDIGLPDMDGYQVARNIRQNDRYTGTLIALTGYGQDEDRTRAYEAGFNHHLTKPISIIELEALLGGS